MAALGPFLIIAAVILAPLCWRVGVRLWGRSGDAAVEAGAVTVRAGRSLAARWSAFKAKVLERADAASKD